MTCIILDDEPKAVDVLQRYTDRLPDLTLLAAFRDPAAALTFLKNTPVDLLFLDINMPGLSGLQVLAALEKPPLVVFTTAYPEYAAHSYELDAVDYLLKPVLFERFEKAVAKARKTLLTLRPPETPEFINLKSGVHIHRVRVDDILLLQKEGNYFTVFTGAGQRIVIRQNMESALQMLPPGLFQRVHRSYIVALRHVSVVKKGAVVVGGYEVPVGRGYRVWE